MDESFGRILRENVRAAEDMPAFDRSAMDGYAVVMNDNSKRFRIIGEIQPGVAPKFKIKRGECARIFYRRANSPRRIAGNHAGRCFALKETSLF
ncbi:MAG: hypothetical protein WDM76_02595 [Limisphaerales bacterium]